MVCVHICLTECIHVVSSTVNKKKNATIPIKCLKNGL